jgi:hypothetical protein
MNYNQPSPLHTFQDMELSSEYHTQVSPHRFMQQSNAMPFMNLQVLDKLPIEQLLAGFA